MNFEDIRTAWGQGHTDLKHLEYNEDGLRGLVEYVLEGRASVKRWTCSQNLNEPAIRDHGPYALSASQVRHINENPFDTEYIERLYPGWKVAKVDCHPECQDVYSLFVVTR